MSETSDWDNPVTVEPSDMETASKILQEAPMDQPTIRVIGTLDGENKVVKPDWTSTGAITLSTRTLAALEKIGINIVDNPEEYLF